MFILEQTGRGSCGVVVRTLAQTLFGGRKRQLKNCERDCAVAPEMEKLESVDCVACASRAIAGQVLGGASC